jgi:ComF family protein
LSVLAATTRILVDPVLALVFPARCPACRGGVERPRSGPLCQACWDGLPRHRVPPCACGRPLSAAAGSACGRCRRGLSPVVRGASLGPYEGALRVAVHELKYRGRRRAARRLADALLESPAALAVLEPEAVLVPVPLHPRRRRERAFNQAELLAVALGAGRGLPVCRDALVRRKDTPAQTGLSAAARRRNVAGAFVVRRQARVAGRVVVLVDDVLTTGATTRACAEVLRRAGAAEVRVLTVARVA